MWSLIAYQPIESCLVSECGSPGTTPLGWRPTHRLLLHFKEFSRAFIYIYIIFNTKKEKLNKKMTIFTILSCVPSIVVEPSVYRKPPRVDLLLV